MPKLPMHLRRSAIFIFKPRIYRDRLKRWYAVARTFFLLLLDFSAWVLLRFAHFLAGLCTCVVVKEGVKMLKI